MIIFMDLYKKKWMATLHTCSQHVLLNEQNKRVCVKKQLLENYFSKISMDLLYRLICFDRTPVEHGDTLQTAHFSVKIEIYNIHI